MVPESYYTALSAVLFAIGVVGVVIRRNPLVIFMSIELMLNAANLALVAFAHRLGNLEGQVLVFFVMAVAAAEVAVGPRHHRHHFPAAYAALYRRSQSHALVARERAQEEGMAQTRQEARADRPATVALDGR